MEADDWKTIKHVTLEALEQDVSRRRQFLDQANLSAEARAEVESLLRFAADAANFMTLSVGEFSKDFIEDVTRSPLINQRIGVYEIVSELGVGGMGAVYLAMRVDGKFEQRVAIKMLKREFNTEKIRRTFTREKEILAALSHPNIATLLDAGTTRDGIPYLVMEYVKGEPIDNFCQKQKLSLDERLKLFNKVCDAVAFAHRNLIVHRDLKPSNILVNEKAEPKLLDFGISKLLDTNGDDAGQVTQLGALTPQYASPEQINGQPVTTTTDIYSLGVVLFRILTENFPNQPATKGNGRLLREITDSGPTLPSSAAVTPVIRTRLKGDLDNIILKALSKEPERRYQTVEQFSADIWRFVDGLPVLARPATVSYRLSKFVTRNKVQIIAAGFVVVALLVGITVALSQAKAAREQARVAREQRDAAQQERARAEKTSRFMQSFLNYANPHWSGLGSRDDGRTDFTVREALQEVVKRMDAELADSPEVRADLHYTIGEVDAGSGEREPAQQHFRLSLELYRQVLGEEHPKVARAIYYAAGAEPNDEKAEMQLRQAVAIMRRTDPDNVNLPHMLQSLAVRIAEIEKERRTPSHLAEAEAFILEAQSLFKRRNGGSDSATVSTYNTLASIALARGDLVAAESFSGVALKHFEQTRAGLWEHIWALAWLGEVKHKMGKESEAEALFGQALELARKRWSANDRQFEKLVSYIKKTRAEK